MQHGDLLGEHWELCDTQLARAAIGAKIAAARLSSPSATAIPATDVSPSHWGQIFGGKTFKQAAASPAQS
jgi:hypothetical protein